MKAGLPGRCAVALEHVIEDERADSAMHMSGRALVWRFE